MLPWYPGDSSDRFNDAGGHMSPPISLLLQLKAMVSDVYVGLVLFGVCASLSSQAIFFAVVSGATYAPTEDSLNTQARLCYSYSS